MVSPSQDDLTPISGSATDVAPVGLSHSPSGDSSRYPWAAIAATPEFQELVRAKLRFIVPATIFFVTYYLLLPVLVGYCPGLMKTEVIGHANLAYLFGLSQFFVAWILAAIYVKVAGGWDRRAARIIAALPSR